MSGRGRQQISPTLFPFLAVLVCTLGTLILFLALVAQDSTQKVKRQVEEEAKAQANVAQSEAEASADGGLTSATVKSMIAEEEFRVSQLVSFRDAQAADVEQRRDQLTHLEDHLRRIRDELKRLSDEVKQATGEEKAVEIDGAAVAELRERLQAEEESLVELKQRVQSKAPRIVIVPHKGPNGTDRRPIYLECTGQGLVIWPEGSVIPMKGLRDADTGANPLDETLRIVRHHVMQNYGDTTPPYPLLVVRPDGYASYHLSRRALGDWDDQFGVELIPDEIELAIPNPDSNLRNRIDVAIQSAMARQRSVGTREQIAFGEKRTGKPRPLSAKDLDMQAQSHGFESVRGVPTNGWDLSKASPYNVDRSGQSQRRSSNMDNQANEPYQAAAISGRELKQLEDEMRRSAADMRESAGGGGDRSAEAMLLSSPNGNGGMIHGSSNMTSQGSGSSLLGNPATGNTSAGNKASSDPPSLLAQSGRDPSMDDFLNQSHGRPDTGNAMSSGSDGMSLSNPSGMNDVSASGSSANTANANSGKSADQSNASTGFTMPSDTASSSADSGGGDSRTGSDADVNGSNGGTSGTQSSGQASASGSPQSGASQGSAGAGGSSQPPAEGQIGGSAPPQNPNLVKPNKRDWALPDSVAQSRGNSIVRTIRVVCDEGQFVLLGSAMSGGTEVFGFSDKPVSTATLELATAVRDRIDRWGPSLPGGRWSPVLDVEVMPGGEARFEQLRKLMQGSGVEVVGKVAQ